MSADTVEQATPATEAEDKIPAGQAELESFQEFLDGIATKVADDGIESVEGEDTIESAVTLYQGIPSEARSARTKAKKYVTDAMTEAVGEDNDLDALRLARVYMKVGKAIKELAGTSTKSATPKEPVDQTPLFIDRYVTLQVAAQIYLNTPPEGVDSNLALEKTEPRFDDLQDDVLKYVEWLVSTDENKGDAPEVDQIVLDAAKIAAGKATKVRKASTSGAPRTPQDGPRRRIHIHMQEALDASDKDFLPANELAKFESEEYKDGNPPSPGAITARIDKALERDTKLIAPDHEIWAIVVDGVKGVTSVNPN